MSESGWRERLRRIFRRGSPANAPIPLAGHPFRTAPAEIEPALTAEAERAEQDLPESLRTLLEKKRGTSV